MLALGERYGSKVFSLLDDDELRQISIVMSTLGTVTAEEVEILLLEVVNKLSSSGGVLGNYDATERLLQQYLPADRVHGIMEEIRGPAGRNMWDKLGNVHEEVLANYLKNEYPQTVAVVLSKIKAEHAARVLRDPARGLSRSTSSTHAAHGAGAEGDPRQDRTDAAHRIHVEPVADTPARQPRDDGGDLQRSSTARPRRASSPRWRSATARPPSASGR